MTQSGSVGDNPLKECPNSPNCYRTTIKNAHPEELVYNSLVSILKEMNAIELNYSSSKQAHAVFKIPFFGWLDDVDIIITKDHEKNTHSFVHLRSASRAGYFDLFANKLRVRRILNKLNKTLKS